MIERLYEDNHVLVAVKPPNLLSQGDATGDSDILTLLKADIKERYQKPGNVYLGLVHRLDRPVGGLMVFARTSKAAARLSDQMRTHALGREYLCAAPGTLPEQFTLEDWLLKDTAQNQVKVCSSDMPGAQRAVLHGTRLTPAGELALYAIRLETGRSHQIRVQMAHAGAPLWGDHRYGNAQPGQQIALYGYRLRFVHPTTHEGLAFQSLPKGSVWEQFPDLFRSLEEETL